MGVGRYLKEQKPDGAGRRGRAAGGRAGAGSALPRRRLRAADLRPARSSTGSSSCARASRSSGCDACSTSAACSPASRRARRSRARRRWPPTMELGHDRHAASPTAGGSTSRRARGPTTSTWSRSAPRASTTGSAAMTVSTDVERRGRRAASRRTRRVPDRDRLRPGRRRRRTSTRSRRLYRGEAATRRPSGDRAPAGRRRARRLGDRRSPTGARRSPTRAGPVRSPWCSGASARVPDAVTGGRDTVGLRVPDQPLALALLRGLRRRCRRTVGEPVRSGEPDHRRRRARPTSATTSISCSTADRAAWASSRRSSTARATHPAILRLGGVREGTRRGDRRRPSPLRIDGEIAAPGTLPSHYAPSARVVVVAAADVRRRRANGRSPRASGSGCSRCTGAADGPSDVVVLGCRRRTSTTTPATSYARLRDADASGSTCCSPCRRPPAGIGAAVADRLAGRGRGPR